MTYLKYADLCATHVMNCLKEPKKTQALSKSSMHIRMVPWTNGKRGKAGALTVLLPPSLAASGGAPRGGKGWSLRGGSISFRCLLVSAAAAAAWACCSSACLGSACLLPFMR
jgi:F-type H+-transporting ATPase subunit epsilon